MKGKKTNNRREEILEAVLTLLGEMPLSELSTRKIARRLGVTQPSLFRHFRSKEALLVALVERAREQMGKGLEGLLHRTQDPKERLLGFLVFVLRMAGERPGLPRLLFHDTGEERKGPLGRALAALVSMQENMASVLLGDLGLGKDPEERRKAARRLVALIQGTVLQEIRQGAALDPVEEAEGILSLFVHGVSQGGKGRMEEAGDQERGILLLDVRPILEGGEDPLGQILLALDGLPGMGVLLLRAPFRPGPLLALLGDKGYQLEVEEREGGVYEVLVRGKEGPPLEDLRDLPAPEPMERVLGRCAEMPAGQTLAFRTPRVPRLLLQRLREKGLETHVQSLLDGSALLLVRS